MRKQRVCQANAQSTDSPCHKPINMMVNELASDCLCVHRILQIWPIELAPHISID